MAVNTGFNYMSTYNSPIHDNYPLIKDLYIRTLDTGKKYLVLLNIDNEVIVKETQNYPRVTIDITQEDFDRRSSIAILIGFSDGFEDLYITYCELFRNSQADYGRHKSWHLRTTIM